MRMNVTEWLEKVKKMDESIDRKLKDKQALWDLATKITPELSDMPHGTGVTDKVGNLSVKLVEIDQVINFMVDAYVDHRERVIGALELLYPKECGVLYRQYIEYKNTQDIANEMGYCTRQVSRIRKNGLNHLKDVLECHGIPMV